MSGACANCSPCASRRPRGWPQSGTDARQPPHERARYRGLHDRCTFVPYFACERGSCVHPPIRGVLPIIRLWLPGFLKLSHSRLLYIWSVNEWLLLTVKNRSEESGQQEKDDRRRKKHAYSK